jgi:hypothetical protein
MKSSVRWALPTLLMLKLLWGGHLARPSKLSVNQAIEIDRPSTTPNNSDTMENAV